MTSPLSAGPDIGPDAEPLYTNRYRCSGGEGRIVHAEEVWEDQWDCICNDRCPICNAEIEPYESEEAATGEVTKHC